MSTRYTRPTQLGPSTLVPLFGRLLGGEIHTIGGTRCPGEMTIPREGSVVSAGIGQGPAASDAYCERLPFRRDVLASELADLLAEARDHRAMARRGAP